MLVLFVLTLLPFSLSAATRAQSAIETIDDLDSPVAKGSPITWHMLVANVFKGIHDDTDSRQWVTASEKVLRQIGTKDRTILAAGSPLLSFDALRVRADGKRYIEAARWGQVFTFRSETRGDKQGQVFQFQK